MNRFGPVTFRARCRAALAVAFGMLLAMAAPRLQAAPAQGVAVGAASNLLSVVDALHAEFRRQQPGVAVKAITGASGSLFAQIRNGAPIDVFLSADTDYPRQLAAAGLADAADLRTFARGRLVCWTTRAELDLGDLAALVRSAAVRRIAIAQPQTAPYGRAAQAFLERLGVWAAVRGKIVIGENITQTAQFIETGNAELGFVAMSVVVAPRMASVGRWREIPAAELGGIDLDHGAVLTTRGARNPVARAYLEFLLSSEAQAILARHGYALPSTRAR